MNALRASILLVALWTASGNAATIHVPGDQPTIQAAIDVAVHGDEIVLADGIFAGPGNRDLDCGGRAITIRSASGDPALTTIQCGGTAGDPHRGFLFQSGEGAGSVLEGVTVSGGFAPGLPESRGGGAICTNGSSPTFRSCVFTSNEAKFGGGVYCEGGASPSFVDCEFVGNHATDGVDLGQAGAVAFWDAAPSFAGCAFRANVAALTGGAIWGGSSGEVVFTDCLFDGNRSRNAGGAGYVSSGGVGSVRFGDCVFVDNDCENELGGGGGALGFFRVDVELDGCTFERNSGANAGGVGFTECDATVTGCTFEENVADRSAGAVHTNQDATATFEDCAFLRNEARGQGHPDFGGGAVHASTGTRTSFLGCLFVGNTAENGGGVYRTQHSFLTMTRCTLVGQGGAAVGFFGSGQDTLSHTIIAFTEEGPGIACASNVLTVECCDIFGNAGGDAICGIDAGGNFAVDPLFCDAAAGDFTIQVDSPCAPPGVTGCGLVGALDVGCGPVPVEARSWARIKAQYRPGAR